MNEIRAAAGADNQRQRATPATAPPSVPAGNTNQPPRPSRRRRSRRRRGRSASTGTGPVGPAEQPVVAAPPTKPATAGQPAAAPPRAHLGPRGRTDRRPAGRAHGQARHPYPARAGPGLQGGDAHRLDSRPARRDAGAPGHLPGATRRRLLLRHDAVAAGWSADADQPAPLAPGSWATGPR